MCGRYSLTSYTQMHGWKPRYNISPSQFAPIVTKDETTEARFGLVPSWEKVFTTKFSTINARAETVQTSKLYSRLLKQNRCLIPANSFFEWVTTDEKIKQPYLFKLKDRKQFFFAGLYDTWHRDKEDEHKSFTIITTQPNEFMSRYHNRMPKILEKDQEKPWLKEKQVNFNLFFKDQFPSNQIEAYKVSRQKRIVVNDSPMLIQKLKG